MMEETAKENENAGEDDKDELNSSQEPRHIRSQLAQGIIHIYECLKCFIDRANNGITEQYVIDRNTFKESTISQ